MRIINFLLIIGILAWSSAYATSDVLEIEPVVEVTCQSLLHGGMIELEDDSGMMIAPSEPALFEFEMESDL